MEHRWGKRIPTQLSARLSWQPQSFAVGRLRDVSLSGGFVERVPSLAPWTEVHVQIEQTGHPADACGPVKGYVVRADNAGVALEWCEFAPPEIRSLIDGAGAARFTPYEEPRLRGTTGFSHGMRETRCSAQTSPPMSAVQGFNAALP